MTHDEQQVPRRDRGASLIELLISIVVMGIISTVLLAVVATFLRNDSSSSQRIDESRDLQQITAYLPGDLSSAFLTELTVDTDGNGVVDAAEPSTAVACPGYSTAGNNVLSLKWNESFGGTTKQARAQYRTQVVGTETRIVRITCSGVSLGTATVQTVARQLRTTNPVTVAVNGALVTLTLTEKSGRTLTISVTTQNPHAELEYSSDYDT
jgi:Tfp pilus assembly protein PilV